MKLEINSIQNRILTGFLVITFIALITYVFSYYYLLKVEKVRSFDREISRIETLTLNLIKLDNDFFDLESINPVYFTTRKSALLQRRDSVNNLLQNQFNSLPKEVAPYFNIEKDLNEIDSLISIYNESFNDLASLVFKRGFKNYGLEGKMRGYAHALEDEIKMTNILSLRRHEKDFFLRNELEYVDMHNALSERILSNLRENNPGASNAINLVEKYSDAFNQLVLIQRAIGINSNEGLRSVLNNLTFILNDKFAALSVKTGEQASASTGRVLAVYIISVVVSLVVAIVLSYFIAHRLSRPIRNLSFLMQRYMTKKTPAEQPLTMRNPTSEMKNLSRSFFSLMRQTQNQMREIKSKSIQLRKQNKELKKLNDELDRFIYSTAHDLRSPLSSVLGLINLAEFDRDEDQRDKYLEMMKVSISKLESFIRDVVDYSKNKKLSIDVKKVDLEDLIQDVFEDHRHIPASKEITLQIEFPNQKIVYSDPSRLRIVFNNLISNAIRYSDLEKEIPFIAIAIEVTDTFFTIHFRDNGQGIEAAHLNKIFDMFYRANERSSGSGLGLFILKETIENLDGQVEVKSEINEGTIFKIRLPNKLKKFKFRSQKVLMN